MEPELDEGFLFVSMDGSEDFGCIQFDLVVDVFVHVKGKQWHVNKEGSPLSRNQQQKSDKRMYSSFWNNVLPFPLVSLILTPQLLIIPYHIQLVAQINRVDVVRLKVRIHHRKENLHKQVSCIHKHRR